MLKRLVEEDVLILSSMRICIGLRIIECENGILTTCRIKYKIIGDELKYIYINNITDIKLIKKFFKEYLYIKCGNNIFNIITDNLNIFYNELLRLIKLNNEFTILTKSDTIGGLSRILSSHKDRKIESESLHTIALHDLGVLKNKCQQLLNLIKKVKKNDTNNGNITSLFKQLGINNVFQSIDNQTNLMSTKSTLPDVQSTSLPLAVEASPPEVTTTSSSTRRGASSNSIPVNGKATPGDRGEDNEEEQEMLTPKNENIQPGGTGNLYPEERRCSTPKNENVQLGGTENVNPEEQTSNVVNGPRVEPGSDLRELEGEVNREADGRNVTSGGTASGPQVDTSGSCVLDIHPNDGILIEVLDRLLDVNEIVLLMDLYCCVNKLVLCDLYSPNELYNSVMKLTSMGKYKLISIKGMQLITKSKSNESDYYKDVIDIINQHGPITTFEFSKIKDISITLAEVKIHIAETLGLIVRDESIEQVLYYKNNLLKSN